MVTSNLDKIFNHKNVAIVGASDEKGSVGYMLIKNLTGLGYSGKIYPIKIRKNDELKTG